jgi:hypothetical protein
MIQIDETMFWVVSAVCMLMGIFGLYLKYGNHKTLSYFERLKAAGVPEPQAKAQIDVMRDIVEAKHAEQKPVTEMYLDLRLKELQAHLEVRMAESKADTLKWVAGMLAAQAAVVAALVKLL